ncbi:hypothetical protein OBBRIDRAFT_610712 [Obba rivulosa]|uniref:Uncharacterized protein n=1 Tax=Obba rivulosa TaxID=1052685 RepID=A0A8E2DKP9_9APHY|nr:hypothetical protein OBBRIDRAFT_610712 [Obba rivulosa]
MTAHRGVREEWIGRVSRRDQSRQRQKKTHGSHFCLEGRGDRGGCEWAAVVEEARDRAVGWQHRRAGCRRGGGHGGRGCRGGVAGCGCRACVVLAGGVRHGGHGGGDGGGDERGRRKRGEMAVEQGARRGQRCWWQRRDEPGHL